MTEKIKYASTPHVPWSFAQGRDDTILTKQEWAENFLPKNVYVTEKRDGECTTIGKGYSHARSLDSKDHWSRHHIKALASKLYNDIEDGWRICGENLLATHSLEYTDLISFFEVFSVWTDKNEKLSLDDTLEYCYILDLLHVPILKRGSCTSMAFDHNKLGFGLDEAKNEGYVISNDASFHWNDFRQNIAKCVRANHVQTDSHWMYASEKRNKLK